MQISKKTRKSYMAVYVDNKGMLVNYKRNDKVVQYKTLQAINRFLEEQNEKVKGYYVAEITERVIVTGVPKGHKCILENVN